MRSSNSTARTMLVLASAAALSVGVSPTLGAAATSSVPGDAITARSATLDFYVAGVETLAPDDVWAVGYQIAADRLWSTKAAHWDGSSWTVVATPSPAHGPGTYLAAVSGTGPDDVWAVGRYWNGEGHSPDRLLIEHWDGSAWSIVPSARPRPVGRHHQLRYLSGVSATSSDDVWAVGYASGQGSVAEHWDGERWAFAELPPVSRTLIDVSANSGADVWAVGQGERSRAAALRFDGTAWEAHGLPRIPHVITQLYGVAAVASNDVWATGTYIRTDGHAGEFALLEHWDGVQWQRTRDFPLDGAAGSALYAAAASGPDDVWATGAATDDDGLVRSHVEHWDGSAWQTTTVPASMRSTPIETVDAPDHDDAWVVAARATHSVVAHWDGIRWRVVT